MFSHPLWLVGFRPFFILAFISGAALPLVWAMAFSGRISLPSGLNPIQWHAHEMLFGFGWAVLGGFLLTASKNWVKIRGMHGGPLALAVLLWVVERVAVLLPIPAGSPLFVIVLNAFGVYLITYLVWTLVRYRRQDTFPDNGFFVVALPVFLVAKNLVLSSGSWSVGAAMTIGIFRVAFAVMFERTMTQFMKNSLGAILPRRRWLDTSIKSLVLLAVFEPVLPSLVAAVVLSAAAILLFARWLTWKPLLGLRRFEIGIMYVGYLGLVIHLALSALRAEGLIVPVGTLPLHAFTFLCMGLVIPAMLIRISQGHTGRKLVFTRSDRLALWAMGTAGLFRLVATQLWPGLYMEWIILSAIGWSACFAIIGFRVVPFLWLPRVDGRKH